MKIFVGGLSRDATEDDVRNAFSAHGRVTSVAVLKDKFTGEPRGFGFVEMESKAEAEAAINALNGTELKGRTLTVNEARPKTDRPRGGVVVAAAGVVADLAAVVAAAGVVAIVAAAGTADVPFRPR